MRSTAGYNNPLTTLIIIVLFLFSRNIAACQYSLEQEIINSILDLDIDAAISASAVLDTESSLIKSRLFYQNLVGWAQATLNKDHKQKKRALENLRAELSVLKKRFSSSQSVEDSLSWNLAAAHTARLLLEDEQIITGYKLGSKAVKNLQDMLTQENINSEQRSAASLVVGLSYIYSNSIPDQFSWAKPVIKVKSDLDSGRKLVELAIESSSVFTNEAARALLLEIPWSTPAFCNYLHIAETLSQRFQRNIDISMALQGILIRCGHPLEALKENTRIQLEFPQSQYSGFSQIDYNTALELGRIRAKANARVLDHNDIQGILDLQDDSPIKWHALYALANFHDLTHQRNKAKIQYQAIIDTKSTVTKALRANSVARIKYPYDAPHISTPKPSLALMSCQ